jgi:hypothetical protein
MGRFLLLCASRLLQSSQAPPKGDAYTGPGPEAEVEYGPVGLGKG